MLNAVLLGSSGTLPTSKRPLTSMFVSTTMFGVLVDCGEGTLVSAMNAKVSIMDIDVICITHRHADHVLGLPGILTTINHHCSAQNITKDIVIVVPIDSKDVIQNILRIITIPMVHVAVYYISDDRELLDFGAVQIETMKMSHSVDCYGYKIIEPGKGQFDIELAEKTEVEQELWSLLQKGAFIKSGDDYLTIDNVNGKKGRDSVISYVTDTSYCPEIAQLVKGSDLCVVEGMYSSKEEATQGTMHLTFQEAAEAMKEAGVEEAWLTHFTPSLQDPEEYLENASSIFENIKVGYNNLRKTVHHKQSEQCNEG